MFQTVADVPHTLDQVRTELCDQLVALATNWESQRDSEWPDGHLPSLNVPGRAYFVLSQLDRERAAHFLIGHFDYVKLSKGEREDVIRKLIELCVPHTQRSETAMARLTEIAKEAAPGAEGAIAFLRRLRLANQLIGLPHSLEELGVTGDVWESWALRLQPPGTFDFDDSVLEEALRSGNSGLAAAALLFRAEFAREKGQDSQILTFTQRAVELLPDNPATLDAIVQNLESFHRPGDALKIAERLAEVDPTFTNRWGVGRMRYLSGDKAGAIELWRSLKESDEEDKLKLYIDGCERRLVQYEKHKASKK
jgi:tetratricopeptide (TPR) repeat protein